MKTHRLNKNNTRWPRQIVMYNPLPTDGTYNWCVYSCLWMLTNLIGLVNIHKQAAKADNVLWFSKATIDSTTTVLY